MIIIDSENPAQYRGTLKARVLHRHKRIETGRPILSRVSCIKRDDIRHAYRRAPACQQRSDSRFVFVLTTLHKKETASLYDVDKHNDTLQILKMVSKASQNRRHRSDYVHASAKVAPRLGHGSALFHRTQARAAAGKVFRITRLRSDGLFSRCVWLRLRRSIICTLPQSAGSQTRFSATGGNIFGSYGYMVSPLLFYSLYNGYARQIPSWI